MRQELLRIRIDSLTSTVPVDGVFAIGIGFFLIPWALLGLWWAIRVLREHSGIRADMTPVIFIWIAFAIGILVIPRLNFDTKSFPVYGYGFMLFLGFVAAAKYAVYRAEKEGIHRDVIMDLLLWLFFSGIFGARLFYLVQYHERVFGDCKNLGDYIWAAVNLREGGLVLYGGLLCGLAAHFLFCHRRKIGPLYLADVYMPSVFIGVAFGRLGCFMNGCCYGDVCQLPWRVTFPSGSIPFRVLEDAGFLAENATVSLPLHPTQIYSSLNAVVIAIVIAVYFKYRTRDGAALTIALILYPITRIIIEFLRADEIGKLGTSFTISQWIGLGVFCVGLVLAGLLAMSSPTRLTRGYSSPTSS